MATAGELLWGVKESFRQYVDRSEGVTHVSGGASINDDGRITFPFAGAEAIEGGPQVFRFGGGVEFDAHGGLLAVRLREPWLEAVDGEVTLTVMHPAFREATERRLPLCRVDATGAKVKGGVIFLGGAPTTLLMEATGIFDNLYPPGIEFDPLTCGQFE